MAHAKRFWVKVKLKFVKEKEGFAGSKICVWDKVIVEAQDVREAIEEFDRIYQSWETEEDGCFYFFSQRLYGSYPDFDTAKNITL